MQSFSTDGKTPTESVLYSIADVTGTPVTQLPPLYHSIDTDALNEILSEGQGVEVSFEYYDAEVTVTADQVLVEQLRKVDDFGAEASC